MSTASVGFHCPECARHGRQKVYTRANWSDSLRRPLVAQGLVAVNVAAYVLGLVADANDAVVGRGGLALDGGLFGPAVAAGEWYRIVSAGFLHAGLMHLAFNMLALLNLGAVLEPALGRARFAAVYATSLLTGSLGVLLLSPDKLTVGASGAVFGLMGALLVAQRAKGIDPWQSGLGGVLAINLLITFSLSRYISVGGHLGGLAGGLLAGWVLLVAGPRVFGRDEVPLAIVVGLGAAAFAGSLLVA